MIGDEIARTLWQQPGATPKRCSAEETHSDTTLWTASVTQLRDR